MGQFSFGVDNITEEVDGGSKKVVGKLSSPMKLVFPHLSVSCSIEELINGYKQPFIRCVEEMFDMIENKFALNKQTDKLMKPLEASLFEVKQSFPINETAFFIKEFGLFCQYLQSEPLKSTIDEYKQELLTIMQCSSFEGLDSDQQTSQKLQNLTQRFYSEIFKKCLGENISGHLNNLVRLFSVNDSLIGEQERKHLVNVLGIRPEFVDIIIHILNPRVGLPIDHEVMSQAINHTIDTQLEMFYPIASRQTSEEETCSVHVTDLFLRAFVIHSLLRLTKGEVSFDKTKRINKQDYLDFLHNAAAWVFNLRYPKTSYLKSLEKHLVQSLLQSQLHL